MSFCIDLSGTSSVAVAWSGTFDELIGGHILDYFKNNIPINVSGLAPYPDFFAVGLILILSGNSRHISLCPLLWGLLSTVCSVKHSSLRFPPRRVGVRSEGVSDHQQDLHRHQHPGAAVCGHLRIHQGQHHQLADQQRGAEFNVRKRCPSAPCVAQLQDFPHLLSNLASTEILIPLESLLGVRGDSSLTVLLGPWLELQPAFTLLSGLTASQQQVRHQNHKIL